VKFGLKDVSTFGKAKIQSFLLQTNFVTSMPILNEFLSYCQSVFVKSPESGIILKAILHFLLEAFSISEFGHTKSDFDGWKKVLRELMYRRSNDKARIVPLIRFLELKKLTRHTFSDVMNETNVKRVADEPIYGERVKKSGTASLMRWLKSPGTKSKAENKKEVDGPKLAFYLDCMIIFFLCDLN
jgi:hypothetical protein